MNIHIVRTVNTNYAEPFIFFILELIRRYFVFQEFQGCNTMLDHGFFVLYQRFIVKGQYIEKQLYRTSEPASGTNPVLIEDIFCKTFYDDHYTSILVIYKYCTLIRLNAYPTKIGYFWSITNTIKLNKYSCRCRK